MKFGICAGAEAVIRGGLHHADYVEVSGKEIYSLESAAFRQLRTAIKENRVPAYSCNCLIDPALRLTGPDVHFDAIRSYCDTLFARLAELGVEILVFGSGKAKRVPDGFPMEQAWEQLFELGALLADKAAPYGQTVVVEPLSYKDVNIVNTVEDGAVYVKTVNRNNFKLLVDFYHFDANNEPFSSLEPYSSLFKLTHFATPKERSVPRNEEEWSFFSKCLTHLKAIGYTGAMTFEGKDFEPHERDMMLDRMKEIAKEIKI